MNDNKIWSFCGFQQIIKSYRWTSIYNFCDKNAVFAHFCDKMPLWQNFATKMPHLQIYATKMPYLQFFATKKPHLQIFATKIPWWILNVFPAPLQWHARLYLFSQMDDQQKVTVVLIVSVKPNCFVSSCPPALWTVAVCVFSGQMIKRRLWWWCRTGQCWSKLSAF